MVNGSWNSIAFRSAKYEVICWAILHIQILFHVTCHAIQKFGEWNKNEFEMYRIWSETNISQWTIIPKV